MFLVEKSWDGIAAQIILESHKANPLPDIDGKYIPAEIKNI